MPLNTLLSQGAAAGAEPAERASILIVDDLPEKLLVFGTVLESLGQNLVFVRSGSDALREVLKQEFAVILLDVNMPDIDGFETATLIRRYRRSAHTPIIFITAYADEMQTARGYSLGAVDYILSPLVPEILCSKVQVFVELFLLQRRIHRQADERVALAASEAARRVAEENTRLSTYLAQASRQLSDSLDIDVAVQRLLHLVVPELAQLAAVVFKDSEMPGEHGSRQLTQLALSPGEQQPGACMSGPFAALPELLQDRCTQAMDSHLPVTLNTQALSVLDAQGGEPFTSGLLMPLLAGDRILGVLLVASRTGCDSDLLGELAARAAVALENARLYSSLQVEIVERRAAELNLQLSNQRKDEFLAMLSHELRNPLAPIRNAVEVMRRIAPPDPKLRWANEVMDRQVSHLTRLVEELLDVARISQGKITLHAEPVDLLTVIEHALETSRPFIEHRQHALTLSLPRTPVWLRGDFARLSQVVANLLNNAAKYTEAGGTIQLSLSTPEGQALISVRDNGVGIEPELLPHVFDLFEQGQRSLDRSQGGLGVGLTLVQRLVQLHHGEVQAVSLGVGQGSEFRVVLPCITQVEKTVPHDEPPEAEEPNIACRVLIVDDNFDAADSVAMVLRLHDHEVKTVSDGPQALACVAAYAPEVVLLDIGLPGLDGYEVARRLRETEPTRQALLIALTGYGQREDVARAKEAGFDHHFVKPADPQALVDCITQARQGRGDKGKEGDAAGRHVSAV